MNLIYIKGTFFWDSSTNGIYDSEKPATFIFWDKTEAEDYPKTSALSVKLHGITF
jgi:hypothetical protein